VVIAQRARANGDVVAFAGGGSDLLGMMKDRLVAPDVLVYLKSIRNLDAISVTGRGLTIGGLTTLDALSRDAAVQHQYRVLAEAAGTVATPQIRHVATLAGNICQRPWCWYYRNGFKCLKNGGTTCYSIAGENQFHAIFGGGPSYIVHPSDTAPALVALGAQIKIAGPAGEKTMPLEKFFVLPSVDYKHENVLAPGEIVTEIVVPTPKAGSKGFYHKVRERLAWDHAIVAVATIVESNAGVVRNAHVVMGGVAPIPWHAAKAEDFLRGKKLDEDVARQAGEIALEGAKPLKDNSYKVKIAQDLIQRGLLASV
jgi:xanthine dehydrogenase YagS FAD-binding subunit